MNENEISTIVFKHPFTCMIAGPSKSGKTTLLKKILANNNQMIDNPPTKIMYCYSRWQDGFDDLKNNNPLIEFNEGLPDIDNFNSEITNLLVLDDLMQQCGKDKSIYDIFTVDSHHKNISVFFLTQNLFPKEKNSRTISLNCNYIIIMDNPRDRSQIYHLARQMFPENSAYLIECFKDVIQNKKFGYLYLDFTQTTSEALRVQTGICIDDIRIIYQPKNLI